MLAGFCAPSNTSEDGELTTPASVLTGDENTWCGRTKVKRKIYMYIDICPRLQFGTYR
jgi:hypothetical protein